MARGKKIKNIKCPQCGKLMKKHWKKAEYECRSPRCPVIFVRIHHNTEQVGRAPRFNET
ncbi:MAG: hypothetical protein OEY24_01655 [Candidatus Bathyarchaeota archaeon]|nr:hypothetical protein [Candidatus Bathyarchaeota archaeon]MDH5494394.1 hypothetical protein [Candidatus Bathyarchaeota archaeon]